MKLGCHAVLFKDKIAAETEQVLSQIQQTGFAGAEIGSRFFGTDKKEYLQQMLKKHGVEMAGMHSGILLTDVLDKKEEAFQDVIKVMEFVRDMPDKNVIMTGLNKPQAAETADMRLADSDMVKEIAIGLNELAQIAGEKGVRLHYHNHSWEFENNGLIFHSIGKYAVNLNFALDTGWAYSMGYDPVALMEQYPDRFHYVHLRDYKKESGEFVDLGNGNMNYKDMMEKLKAIMGREDWAVVEYETGEEDFTRYVHAYEYLQKFI